MEKKAKCLMCYFVTILGFFLVVIDLEKIKSYIDSFRYGAPPHGGGGIGKKPFKLFYWKLNLNLESYQPILPHRSGESLHAVPGSPQRASDLHVPP